MRFTAACGLLFHAGMALAQVAPVGDSEAALRLDLERVHATARAAAQSGDFDAFMAVYEPAKGLALTRQQWPVAVGVLREILARPFESGVQRAVRKGWWAGYYVLGPAQDSTLVTLTMYRFHMSETGWKLRGENVSKSFQIGASSTQTGAMVQREIEDNPAFQLPE